MTASLETFAKVRSLRDWTLSRRKKVLAAEEGITIKATEAGRAPTRGSQAERSSVQDGQLSDPASQLIAFNLAGLQLAGHIKRDQLRHGLPVQKQDTGFVTSSPGDLHAACFARLPDLQIEFVGDGNGVGEDQLCSVERHVTDQAVHAAIPMIEHHLGTEVATTAGYATTFLHDPVSRNGTGTTVELALSNVGAGLCSSLLGQADRITIPRRHTVATGTQAPDRGSVSGQSGQAEGATMTVRPSRSTAADKRRDALALLGSDFSDREIARRAGVSPSTVAAVRKAYA